MPNAWTYATLTAALSAYLVDDGPEFSANLPRIVALAHTRVEQDLDLAAFDATVDVAATAGDAVLAKPANTYATRALYVRDLTGTQRLLEARGFDYVTAVNSDPVAAGTPRYWCDADHDHWRIAPAPDANYCLCARVTPQHAVMDADTNTTTWIGSYTPDALFYAALLESEAFIKADDRIALWQARYVAALAAARAELAGSRRADTAARGAAAA